MVASDFKLKIFFTNVNSLKNAENFASLNTEIAKFSPYLILLTETWIKPYHNSDLFSINDYSLIRADRVVEQNLEGDLISGGGAAAYFHDSLNFQILYIYHKLIILTSQIL